MTDSASNVLNKSASAKQQRKVYKMPLKAEQFTFDLPLGRVPSTWKPPIGKPLTDARILHYQREGYYGVGLKLPPKQGEPCCECGNRKNTTKRDYSYLPKRGYWCLGCIDKYRRSRDQERELKRRAREAFEKEYC